MSCLVFETEVLIESGGAQISDLNTPPLVKVNVHLGNSTPKVLIGTVAKVYADLCSGKCENGGIAIVTQVCGEGGDAKFIMI